MTVGPEGIPVRFLPGFAVAVLFVTAVGVAFFLFLLLLMREGRRRLGLAVRPGFLDRPGVRRGVLAIGVAGILCILYGRFVEPFWIEVSHVRVASSKVSSPVRILHISDTHCDGWGPREKELLEIVRREKPDLMAFTGDAINNPGEGLKAFRLLGRSLQAPSGGFAVGGNWDVWYWNHLDLFGGTAWRALDGDGALLGVRGNRLWVCGAAYDGPWRQALAGAPPDAFTLFLYHTPDLARESRMQEADLYLAGHTHGGQVCLPLYGAMVTLSKHGKDYEGGLYRIGRCALYVCRGLGMEGGIAPRVRFWCRPEVVVIDLVPEPDRR